LVIAFSFGHDGLDVGKTTIADKKLSVFGTAPDPSFVVTIAAVVPAGEPGFKFWDHRLLSHNLVDRFRQTRIRLARMAVRSSNLL
jgi:hypothetical protein